MRGAAHRELPIIFMIRASRARLSYCTPKLSSAKLPKLRTSSLRPGRRVRTGPIFISSAQICVHFPPCLPKSPEEPHHQIPGSPPPQYLSSSISPGSLTRSSLAFPLPGDPQHTYPMGCSRLLLSLAAVFDFALAITLLSLFASAYTSCFLTTLWQVGGTKGWNSDPHQRVYYYANYREPPPVPSVWDER